MFAYKKKLFILAVLTALLIYIISPFNFLHTVAFANGTGSTIGGVEVSDLKDDDLRNIVTQNVQTYQSQLMNVTGAGVTEQIDLTQLQYDINGTINEYKALTDKPWYAFWQKKKVVNIPLKLAPNDAVKAQIANVPQWKTEETYSNVMLVASYLRSHDVEAVVNEVINFDEERLAVVISEIPAASSDIQAAVDLLHDRVIAPNEEFNYLTEIDPILGSVSAETNNFVASLLYQAALKLNAQIAERHSNSDLPNYIPYGLDAYVSIANNKNLRFVNVHDQAVQLKLVRESTNLKVEFYAAGPDETASIRVTRDEEVKPRTIVRYSNNLGYGRSQVLQEGSEGVRVTVYRTNNATGEEEVVAKDYYPPTNRIILKSAKQPPENSGGNTTNPDGTQNPGNPTDPNNPGGTIDPNDPNFPNNPGDGTGSGTGGNGSGSGSGTGNGSGSDDDDSGKYDKGGNLIK